MTNHDNLLGYLVYDKLTNFRGRATAVVEYISGCVQVCISPNVGVDGKEVDSRFFDIQRVAVDHTQPRILLDNEKTPGHGPLPGRRDLP